MAPPDWQLPGRRQGWKACRFFSSGRGRSGLARTEEYLGNRFDIGPHCFVTSNQEVDSLFREMCGDDLVEVERLTRIYYRGKFFDYPLTPVNALFGIGLITGLSFASSYAAARLRRRLRPTELRSFEDWVVDLFGRQLFEAFFKACTEKAWGIACDRIPAQWAAQGVRPPDLPAVERAERASELAQLDGFRFNVDATRKAHLNSKIRNEPDIRWRSVMHAKN